MPVLIESETPSTCDAAFPNIQEHGSNGIGHGISWFRKAATAAKTVTDQALSAGRDLKDKAIDMAGSSSEAIKGHTSDFVDAAKDVASQATGKLKQTVDVFAADADSST